MALSAVRQTRVQSIRMGQLEFLPILGRPTAIVPAALARLRERSRWRSVMSSVPPNIPPGGSAAPVSALRSKDPVAGLPGAAKGRMAGTTRRLESAALRLEGRVWRCLRPAGSSMVGPAILIAIGVVALLVVSGNIAVSNSGPGMPAGGRCCLLLRAWDCWGSGRLTCAGRHRYGAAAALWESLSSWP